MVTLDARPSRPSVKFVPLTVPMTARYSTGNAPQPRSKYFPPGERNQHGERDIRVASHINCEHGRHHNLTEHFLPCKQSVRSAQHNLQIIIQKADHTKSDGHKQNRNNLRIIFYIKHRCDDNTCQYHKSAHRRRSVFLQMGFQFLPLRLPDFESSQERNYNRSQQCTDCKRYDYRDYNFIRHNKHLMYFIFAESNMCFLTQLVYVIFHDLSR